MSERAALQCVVFDFDGLILDTETPEFESWREVFAEHGAELRHEDWIKCVGAGPAAWDVLDHFQNLVGTHVEREWVRDYWRVRRDKMIEGLEPLLGFEELLNGLQQSAIPYGIASSSTREWVVGHLERLGLTHHFPVVMTRSEHAPKPAPDLYLAATRALGADPRSSVALEDSYNGLTAAVAAGMKAVAIPNSVTAGQDFSAATLRAASLAELSVERLSGLVAGHL